MVKEELLEHWDTKPATRAKQFFAYMGSTAGDTNISTMYHTLDTLTTIPKSTTREKKPLNIVMEMTLQLYPKQVRAQLPDYSTMDIKEFLRQADKILSAYSEPDSVAAAHSDSEKETDIIAPIRNRQDYKKYISKKKLPDEKRKQRSDICYYHSRFGERAYRCQTPCRMSKNE